ncbi:MAG TPA: hypothetical protein VH518_17115 [Tepidisphaeraceae bacterium]|jgi:hypothetical protein
MTRLFEQVVSRVSRLSAEQQDELAARWLEGLNDDARWDAKFAATQPQLSKLAAEVRAKSTD